jgi:hypothetical protein
MQTSEKTVIYELLKCFRDGHSHDTNGGCIFF